MDNADKRVKEKRQVLYLVLIMSIVAFTTSGLAIGFLYKAAFEAQKTRLLETVKSQARLIEAVARFDHLFSQRDHPDGSLGATLSQVLDAYEHHGGLGETGEFVLGKKRGQEVVFITGEKHKGVEGITLGRDKEEAMVRALSGHSGIIVESAIDGDIVLSAYEPVRLPDELLGIVAEIDLAEVRAPFYKAGLVSAGGALLAVMMGTALFLRGLNPIIRLLEQSESNFRNLFEWANDSIFIIDPHTMAFLDVNENAAIRLGYSREELLKMSISDITAARSLVDMPTIKGKITAEGAITFEHIHIHKSGREINVEVSSKLINFDGRKVYQSFVRDITKRKKTEEAVTRLGRILENSLDEIYVFYAESLQFVQVNRGARENLEYSMEELRQLTPLDIEPEATSKEFERLLDLIKRGKKERISFKTVFQRKSGSRYPVEVKLSLSSYDSLPAYVAIVQDITEREAVEEELRKKEYGLERAQAIAHLGNWDWDMVEGELFWSDEIYRIFGLTAQKFGATYEAFLASVHPEDRYFVKRAVTEAVDDRKPYNIEHRIIRPDGTVRTVNEQGEVFRNVEGKAIRMMGTVQDITERKIVEEALIESKRQIQVIMDYTADGVITCDEFGFILSYNPAAERMFGYQQATVIGKNVSILMPRPYSDEHDEYIERYRKTGKRNVLNHIRELSGRRRDGSIFPLELTVAEFFNKGEKGFIGTVRDITERKEVEAQLIREKSDLVAAKEAARLKDEFLASISHELRSPLTSVIGFSERVPVKIKKGEYEKALNFVESIGASARHLKGLIDELLDYAKIEAGKLELSREWMAVEKVVDQLHSQIAYYVEEKNIELVIDLSPQMPPIYVDRLRFTQIILNLVTNAVKFTSPGGRVTLKASVEEKGKVVFSVEDTGVGIEKEDRGTVFERFKQVGRARREQGGTGLGLAITKKLVEMHGGHIWVESELEVGSKFYFTLPAKKEKEERSMTTHG